MTDDAAQATGACLLLIGDRVVLRATTPPEAEYAMFDVSEIELRASEPGRVREHGYQTTVEQGRARLAKLGITPALARECAHAMQPDLTDAYARGSGVRRVARCLGPSELLKSETYDGSTRVYRGVFLALEMLSHDLGMDHASATLQALYLASLLEREPRTTALVLHTDTCTKGARPGARTYKRPIFGSPERLIHALGGLSHRSPKPVIQRSLPRADVIAFLRSRADDAEDEDARALYKSLEEAVSLRDMPEKGPLASPELWAVETRIENGELDGLVDTIDGIERRHGRTPGTTYLRARVSLALRLDAPKILAERMSALAMSMTSFQELALLAAEAWLDAGEPRRAIPYARHLIDAPDGDEGLLLRAQRLLARALAATPLRPTPVEPQQSTRPPAVADGAAPDSKFPQDELAHEAAGHRVNPVDPTPAPSSRSVPAPPLSAVERPSPDLSQGPAPTAIPRRPIAQREVGRATEDPVASFTLDLPKPDASRTRSTLPPQADERSSRRPHMSGATIEARPPPSSDPRVEPDTPTIPRSSEKPHKSLAPTSEHASPLERSSFMHGASLPPYRHEVPAPLLPKAPLLPRQNGSAEELVEHLALPPGLTGGARSLGLLPTSVIEARVEFTLLSRELGVDYRLNRGIDLRADASGIEAMQSALLESFPDHVVKSNDDAYEVRRHGALLSEILARHLDAEWLDISPNELGYWAMIVPPDTRVWPFGRIARYIAMGHKERDLVSYFLELKSRARGR